MLKRYPFYGVVLFSVAVFMMAGCASKDVVKKDEGVVAAPVQKQHTEAPKPISPPVIQQATATSTAPTVATSALSSMPSKQVQKASSPSQLQAALEKIYFDFDSATLSDQSRTTLTKNAAAIQKEPGSKILIEGNCDERGSSEYNLALGERRAKAAHQYLVTLGIKSEQLSVISYGKEKPVVQGNNEADMSKNRRDEFVVITK